MRRRGRCAALRRVVAQVCRHQQNPSSAPVPEIIRCAETGGPPHRRVLPGPSTLIVGRQGLTCSYVAQDRSCQPSHTRQFQCREPVYGTGTEWPWSSPATRLGRFRDRAGWQALGQGQVGMGELRL